MSLRVHVNVFIQAKNPRYGFDFCPAFWDWLDQQSASGRVASIEKVLDELKAGADELTTWATARSSRLPRANTAVLGSLRTVSLWATAARDDPAAVSTFFQVADYHLVAHAHAHALTVVTHEVPDNAVKRIKIPNACIALGLKCMTPYEMLRAAVRRCSPVAEGPVQTGLPRCATP